MKTRLPVDAITLRTGIVLVASLMLSTVAAAGVQEAQCFGNPGTDDTYDGKSNVIWQGSMRLLSVQNAGDWFDTDNYERSITAGDIGQCGGTSCLNGDNQQCWSLSPFTIENTNGGETCTNSGQCGGTSCLNGDNQQCWSLSPFTIENTNGGETCTNSGPLAFTTSTTYYRISIDRSATPTVYCQIAMETGPTSSPNSRGNTYVVPLLSALNIVPVPALPLFGLLTLGGLLGFFGLRKLRK